MIEAQSALVKDFRDLTGADEETPMNFLKENFMDVEQAASAYYESAAKDNTEDDSAGTQSKPILVCDSPQDKEDVKESRNLKFLTWNVDGLDQKNLRPRTQAVIDLITSHKPDIVYLQEVIEGTLLLYKENCHGYGCISVDSRVDYCPVYFNAILYNKLTVNPSAPPSDIKFPYSRMGRHLLIQPVLFLDKVPLILMTSHLESTKDCFRERQRQLEMVLEKMEEQDPNSMVLFAGDMNLRDKELNGIGGLDSRGILDVWEKVGNDASKFTWDVSANDNLDWPYPYKPKLRFDRVFVRPGGGVEPVSFSLVGTKRVPSCGRFPSDHWGIWCEFAITNM